ncbi:hypothetical protein A9239_17030 [Methanosarcina sp. A14]|uniref:Peptidase M12B domain-containing protein n=1 Tax=Methanosarcina barkeri MS TaxID=1434108 RepID=A0A0E3QZN0_METBA|nr:MULTISPECIES: M12 family metallo-peptidase [Methanosarcina]AKB56448.1 hypothetical protein MSBRM_3450 [Methanosarcina barkeri MS]OEC93359.1 hypothetical protein A9239_17030 [Methanosarcina sp. A14]
MEIKNHKKVALVMLATLCFFTGLATASSDLKMDSVQYVGNESIDVLFNQYYEEISLDELGKSGVYRLNVPNTITKYDLLLMNPELFKKDADLGKMTIQLIGQNFELQLEPGIWVSKGDKEIIKNETGIYEIDMPEVYNYYGSVVGIPESKVRFTVSDDAVLGWIEVKDVKYIISQAGWMEENGEKKVLHVVYRNTDKVISGVPPASDDVAYESNNTVDVYSKSETFKTQSPSSILSTTTVTLLSAYDTEFKNEFASPGTEIYNMMADVNSAYGVSDIGVNFDADYYYYDSDLSSTRSDLLLGEFRSENSALRDSANCDLAFLFSGKCFSDSAIGRSYVYSGLSNAAYGVAQMVDEPGTTYDGTFDDRCSVVSHELGHNFGADRQDSSHAYAKAYSWSYLGFTRYSIMYTPYKGIGSIGGMQLEFSSDTNHGDATHDNARRISETKSTIANFQ